MGGLTEVKKTHSKVSGMSSSESGDELEYLLRLRERMVAALESSNQRIHALTASIGYAEAMHEKTMMDEQEQEDLEESSSDVD